MLSIRGKTILIVIGIVLVITVSTLGAGLFISQYRFMETVKSDLLSMSKIASGMLSSEIGFLRQEVYLAAERLKDSDNMQHSLEEQLKNSRYLSFSVMDQDGNVLLHVGDLDCRPYTQRMYGYNTRTLAGETVISSTILTPEGNLVMRILTRIDEDRVLIATFSGMYLSDFVSRFPIWKSGNIFVIDDEGVVIASVWKFRVRERHNYIEWGKRDPEYRHIGELLQAAIQNDEGVGRYSLMGVERYSAYQTIAGTDHWSAAVAAPLNESPLSHIQEMLWIFAAVFLGLGIVAALIAANNIAIPYEKMAELRKHAEEASESKTRFLANMSHEMRTPLNAIIGLSELELGMAGLEGDSFTNMEKIYSAGMNLLGIINDLLDISKIESGKFILVPVEYDVPSMINDTINLNIVRIGSKPIQFRLHVSEDLPSRFKGDELRVKQIFNNLLSNAFKYTNSGYVDWTISCRREGGRIKLISSVRDTGMGIRKEDLGKLFKDYYQANLHANYYVEGTGLGLSITNNLVKLMGGSIKVESEFGKGTVFTVEFLQVPAGAEIIGREAADNLSEFRYSAQRRSRNQKLIRTDMSYAAVLVVDDVITNLDVTRGMLKPYGISVDCVTSGPDAIRRIQEENPRYNAIFMDHMMPGMDGIEAVRLIRKEIHTDYAKNIPIIALTANALLGNDSLFLENGFQAFLSKPIDILRLDTVLNQWVRDKRKEKERLLQGPAAPPAASLTPPETVQEPFRPAEKGGLLKNIHIPDLDAVRGIARFNNDEESYLQVLRSYSIHTPGFITTANAVTPDKLADYRIAVHAVKGSSRSIGADALGSLSEALEKAAAAGDWAFIEANNAPFIAAAEKLIADIAAFVKTVSDEDEPDLSKPEQEAPAPETLDAIRQAAEDYDMNALRKAIETLDTYRYRSRPDLAAWLREQAGRSDFEAIKKWGDSH
jgi:signal transduction histidine kinase/CheY-like chemotaxis protein